MGEEISLWLIGGGAVVGLLFGAVVQRSRFCLVAAVSNLVLVKDHSQLHAYVATLGVAIIGTSVLEHGGWVAVADSAYRAPSLNWGGAVLGGLVFGFGAMLAGGCATRTVVRVAEGNLGALVALFGFAAGSMATLYGVLGPTRSWLSDYTVASISAGDGSLAVILGAPQWLVAASAAALCLAAILLPGAARKDKGLILAGAGIGLLVTAGWWTTGYLALDDFSDAPPSSVSISGPLARAGLFVITAQVSSAHFGLALISGILAGGLMMALASGRFRWISPDGSRVGAYLAGGVLMGVGAIVAGGCNIGNGLTGASTISLHSILAFAAMLLGMRTGLWWLQRTV